MARAHAEAMKKDAAYFSQNDREARERFLALARSVAAKSSDVAVNHFEVPSQVEEDLFVDEFFAPATAEKRTLLVLTSGVHGVEAYAGSAVQSMFLEELWSQIPRERVGVLIFHVLNPYGFRTGRRATESNVNLNRNFAAEAALFESKNEAYDRLAVTLEPPGPVKGVFQSIAQSVLFIIREIRSKRFTADSLNRAMASGQYKHARGLEYGGHTWEPQVKRFIDTLRERMRGYQEILIVDLHTGLGEKLQLHLIPSGSSRTTDSALLKKYFAPEEDRDLYAMTPATAEGFYEVTGDLVSVIPSLVTPEQKILGLTFEFGSLGNHLYAKIGTLARLWAENRGYHEGYASERVAREVKERFIEQFNPDSDRWRANVIFKARRVLNRILRAF